MDADGLAGNRVGCRVPRRAASDAGAAPLVPRPCFLANLDLLIVFQIGAKRNDQRFQLGESSHGFLGGQMHQAIPIHNI